MTSTTDGTFFSQAGKLNTYRFCDNVWTFMLNDVEFREAQEMAKVDKVKIVACDGKSEFALSQTVNVILTSIMQSRVWYELQRTCSCTQSTSVQYEEHSVSKLYWYCACYIVLMCSVYSLWLSFIILLIMSELSAHFAYLPCTVCKPCISLTSVTGPTVHCWRLSLPFIQLSLISVSLAMLFETAVEPKGMIVMSVMPYGLNIWLDLCGERVNSSSVIRLVSSFP